MTSTLHEDGVSWSNRGHHVPALTARAVGCQAQLDTDSDEMEDRPVGILCAQAGASSHQKKGAPDSESANHEGEGTRGHSVVET